jgi:hypothetical protein
VEVQLQKFLTSVKENPCPFDRRLGEPQSRFIQSGEEKNSQSPLELKPTIFQHVAQSYTTELSRLAD